MTITCMTNRSFTRVCEDLVSMFLERRPVDVGEWQSQKVDDKPEMAAREILNFSIELPINRTPLGWSREVQPNLPWAEDHFRERVSGEPLNPPPSEAWWPFAVQGNSGHKAGEIFSHTYPERMWPKMANVGGETPEGRQIFVPHVGVRFQYGDLNDVVNQLAKSPATRQAYLPIWFPEDTGAVHGERVPCTLGYHFLIRDGLLHITYYIRSCDFMCHFRDDVYMAGRLAQWVVEELNTRAFKDARPRKIELTPGNLYMHIVNFHVFEGDVPRLQAMLTESKNAAAARLMGAF